MKTLGIFDSGLGGLTVLYAILKDNTYDKIIYFGDTQNVPYGEKTKEQLMALTKKDIELLILKGADEIIAGCGTVSATVLNTISKNYFMNIYGIIDSVVKEAVNTTTNKKIGVIGTTATIDSRVFEKKIKEIDEKIDVYSKACPEFVHMIENGYLDNDNYIYDVIDKYLHGLKEKKIDTIIMGCTHFTILRNYIKKYFYDEINIIDAGECISKIVNKSEKKVPEIQFYVSGDPQDFVTKASRIINLKSLLNTKKV